MPKAGPSYYCRSCDLSLNNRTAFNSHNKKFHSGASARAREEQDSGFHSGSNNIPSTSPTTSTSSPATQVPSTSENSNNVQKRFQCTQCPITFTRRVNLNEHIKSKHSSFEFARKCAMCKTVLTSLEQYNLHTRKCGLGKGFVKTKSAFRKQCSTYTLSLGNPNRSIISTNEILAEFGGSMLQTLMAVTRRHGSVYVSTIITAEFEQMVDHSNAITIPLRSSSAELHSKMTREEVRRVIFNQLHQCASRVSDLNTQGSGFTLIYFNFLQYEIFSRALRFGCGVQCVNNRINPAGGINRKGIVEIPQPAGDVRCFFFTVGKALMPESENDIIGWWTQELGYEPENAPITVDEIKKIIRRHPQLDITLHLYIQLPDGIAPVTTLGNGLRHVQLLIYEVMRPMTEGGVASTNSGNEVDEAESFWSDSDGCEGELNEEENIGDGVEDVDDDRTQVGRDKIYGG